MNGIETYRYEIAGFGSGDGYSRMEHLYIDTVVECFDQCVTGVETSASLYIHKSNAQGRELICGAVILREVNVTETKDSLLKEIIRVSELMPEDFKELDRKYGEPTQLLLSKNKHYNNDKKRISEGIELNKQIFNKNTMSFHELEGYLIAMYDYLGIVYLNSGTQLDGYSNSEIEQQLGIPISTLENWEKQSSNNWKFKLYERLKYKNWHY